MRVLCTNYKQSDPKRSKERHVLAKRTEAFEPQGEVVERHKWSARRASGWLDADLRVSSTVAQLLTGTLVLDEAGSGARMCFAPSGLLQAGNKANTPFGGIAWPWTFPNKL